jgi:hypothetical protein
MPMVKQAHSINSLAVELDRDRRTVAKALKGMRPDGMSATGRPGWFLETALRALQRTQRATGSGKSNEGCDSGGIIELFAQRARKKNPESDPGYVLDVDEAAKLFQQDRAAILTWLRAGMPYLKAGDWKTGEGFELLAHWIFDWITLALIASDAGGEQEAAAELKLSNFSTVG